MQEPDTDNPSPPGRGGELLKVVGVLALIALAVLLLGRPFGMQQMARKAQAPANDAPTSETPRDVAPPADDVPPPGEVDIRSIPMTESVGEEPTEPAPPAEFPFSEGPTPTFAPGPRPEFVSVPVFVATNRERSRPPTFGRGFGKFFTEAFGIVSILLALVTILAFALFGGRERVRSVAGGALIVLALLASGKSLADKWRYDPARNGMFGADAGDMTYLTSVVTVPTSGRNPGEMNRPFSVWIFEASEDPARHIVMQEPQQVDKTGFFDQIRSKVAGSERKDAFVFLHGYNVTFDEAVRRTGQLAFDLGFQGAPICFAWPSQGTELGYSWDMTSADISVPQLQTLLRDLSSASGAGRIYVIAHSMGNRVLAQAVETDPALFTEEGTPFRHVVLAAPDVDRAFFLTRIAPRLTQCKPSITLYGSSHDRALSASKKFNGKQRAGDTLPSMTCFQGIVSVDCSALADGGLGHGYICEDQRVLDDLYALLGDRAPNERAITEVSDGSQRYWKFAR